MYNPPESILRFWGSVAYIKDSKAHVRLDACKEGKPAAALNGARAAGPVSRGSFCCAAWRVESKPGGAQNQGAHASLGILGGRAWPFIQDTARKKCVEADMGVYVFCVGGGRRIQDAALAALLG